jgi:putative serine protease PepD
VTDGWNARPTPPPSSGPANPPADQQAWWSDALTDPWRDPGTPTAVVMQAPEPDDAPRPEPVVDPNAPRRSLTPVLLICLVTALLAGGLGGTLGYLFAVRSGVGGGGGTQLGAPAASQPPPAVNRPADSQAGVAEKLQPSVVTVRVTGAIGSGFVVSQDGYVITNDHVVEGADDNTMAVSFNDGSTAQARLVGRDPESDIAVIKVSKGNLTSVALGNSDQIAVGDRVLAFGSPLGLTNTVTEGIVSALDRTIQSDEGGITRYYAAIQTDAAVNQGNSGGPLVNSAGQVVGVNSVIRSVGGTQTEAGNIGLAFAIPINQAKRIATDIIDHGKARRTVIGADVSMGSTTAGARLQTVEPSGPAAAAGLKAGDVITKLDGHALEDGTDLVALVRSYAPGTVVAVQYRRGSSTANASITLAADSN